MSEHDDLIAQMMGEAVVDGLLGEWLWDGNRLDTSGNGHDGGPTGAVLTLDRFGDADKAYLFSADEINCGRIEELEGITECTFITWNKWSGNQPHPAMLYRTAGFDGNNYSGIWSHISGETFFVAANGSGTFATAPASSEGVWTMHSMVFNGARATNADRLKGYHGGAPLTLAFTGTIPTTLSGLSRIFTFGRFGASDFAGSIDDSWLYSRALSAAEIADIYNETKP